MIVKNNQLAKADAIISSQNLGDSCLLIDCSKTHSPIKTVHVLTHLLFANYPEWALDITPGIDSLLIRLNFKQRTPAKVRELAKIAIDRLQQDFLPSLENPPQTKQQVHLMHICYDAQVAPDLETSAAQCKLSTRELIDLHKHSVFTVDIVGFMPGFAYCSGLNPRLKLPRLKSPRAQVPAGSVAIAGLQTAIYPQSTPGGWNLIGQCPDRLFDVNRKPPGLFMPGDQVQIKEISFAELKVIAAANGAAPTENLAATPNHQLKPDLEIIYAGTLTCIQDLPRYGLMHYAVSPGGAADQAALHLANALVGNSADTSALEITSIGPRIIFHTEALIAWVGGICTVKINEQLTPGNRPVWVAAGSSVEFAEIQFGYRLILAIRGGIDTPTILGRKGSYLSADIGTKRLQKGSGLALSKLTNTTIEPVLEALYKLPHNRRYPKWSINSPYLANHKIELIDALPGLHLQQLNKKEQALFWQTIWTISPQSNRMGMRLLGHFVLKSPFPEIASQGMMLGTVQLPASGEPIIMMAEHQTTGGYPRLAEVIRSAQTKLAQLKPGQQIRLNPVTLEEADAINLQADNELQTTIAAIQIALGGKHNEPTD